MGLSHEITEKLLHSSRREIFKILYDELDISKARRYILIKRIFPSMRGRVLLYYTKNLYPEKYYEELKTFLKSEWLPIFFLYSDTFKFLVFLGLEEDLLLEVFIFISELSKKDKLFFIETMVKRIWQLNGQQEDEPIITLKREYWNLRNKQQRQET